jgi:hypothetical protein
VFWRDDGDRYTTFAGIFRKVARRAGVPFRRHDLRHRFASEFAQRTGDLPALQAILGHKSIQMTMRHSHLVTEHLHRARPSTAPPIARTRSPLQRFRQAHPPEVRMQPSFKTPKQGPALLTRHRLKVPLSRAHRTA